MTFILLIVVYTMLFTLIFNPWTKGKHGRGSGDRKHKYSHMVSIHM